jgi:hypothetical protein
MKFKTIIPAIVVSAASSILFSSFAVAAPDQPKAAASSAPEHSHVHEKATVAPAKESATAAADAEKANQPAAAKEEVKTAKAKAGKDKSRHYHPRDGK